MKSSNTEATYYVGISEYDIDKKCIGPNHVMYIPNTLTELTEDLEDGDTVVHLKNLTNWDTTSGLVTGNDYRRGFIFWNYKDSTGYLYPELTYSRNAYHNLYDNENVNKTDNTITLNEPWSNGTIEKGTKLSEYHTGNTYNYGVISSKNLSSFWETFSNTIGGYNESNSDKEFKKFRYGTKYIKLVIIIISNNINATSYLKNISFKRID